jgi:hypothetical protein
MARLLARPGVSALTEDNPENARAASADVVPPVGSGAIDECAVSLAHPVRLFRVAQRHLPLEHIKQFLLAGLDADLVRGNAACLSVER